MTRLINKRHMKSYDIRRLQQLVQWQICHLPLFFHLLRKPDRIIILNRSAKCLHLRRNLTANVSSADNADPFLIQTV